MGKPTILYESGQTFYPFESATDSGDATTFTASVAPFSKAGSNDVSVALYGLTTGGTITPGSGNDEVDVSALTVTAPGMTGADADGIVSVGSGTVSITRAVSADTHIINSITVDNTGTLVAVTGTDSTSFSETRGAAGGPPLIPVDSIEIGQVRTTSDTAALVTASEIFTVAGTHRELSNSPGYSVDYANGSVTFNSALSTIRVGNAVRPVYVQFATPIFATLGLAYDWSPATTSFTSASTDTYDGPRGTRSESVNSASFTALLSNGVSDAVIGIVDAGDVLWLEYYPDRDVTTVKSVTLGSLSYSFTQQAGGGDVAVTFDVAPELATINVTA